MAKPIRVLIVDDSAISRRMLRKGLEVDERLEVIGTASNPYEARDLIVQLRPDVITLDIDMPRMDGVSFLKRLMPRFPLPVVMVSGMNGMKLGEARSAGAVDVVFKPGQNTQTTQEMIAELRAKIKTAVNADLSHWKKRTASVRRLGRRGSLIALGASTGGTDALEEVLQNLLPGCPGVVIVQHMPKSFTGPFARRLNERSPLFVQEGEDLQPVEAGMALVAPGDQHMTVEAHGTGYRIRLHHGELVSGHRPSVDVLMRSVARVAGADGIGALLTGMGRDGAQGLLEMRREGARTIAQDEHTSIVYGMPRAAWEIGAAERRIPLSQIAPTLLSLLEAGPSVNAGAG